VRKGKRKNVMRSRLVTEGPARKIAFVTLKKGFSLDLYGSGPGVTTTPSEAFEQKAE